MEDDPAKARGGRASITVAVFAFLTAVAITAHGQSHPLATSNERVRQQEMSKREWQLRDLANEQGEAAGDPRRAQAIRDQVEQDFKRILTLHNEFAQSLSDGRQLDYNSVSEAAGEIKKRASRLLNTLALPKSDSDEQNQEKGLPFNERQLRDALIKLCRHIESFVTNPIIATPGTIDAKQLTRARRDLEGVIEISDHLKKAVDKLKKTAR